jgi:hypothetical protein
VFNRAQAVATYSSLNGQPTSQGLAPQDA